MTGSHMLSAITLIVHSNEMGSVNTEHHVPWGRLNTQPKTTSSKDMNYFLDAPKDAFMPVILFTIAKARG